MEGLLSFREHDPLNKMALYIKQDFNPPVFSRKWIAIKFRPNMLLFSRQHIISILESGLLFREDSIEVEQETPSVEAAYGGRGYLTRGEGAVAAAAVGACVLLFPPRSFSRKSLLNVCVYASIPIAVRAVHRSMCRGSLSALLRVMREYLALARRAAACLKEFAALHTKIGSLSSVLEAMHAMLCRQQSELALAMSRTSSALLGNAPWVRDDVAWHAVERDDTDNLMKIHHAFLVVQSTLLKHIAVVHSVPINIQRLYKNHNERLYWIHNCLLPHLLEDFKSNFDTLERMYRLLKNSGVQDNSDRKKLGKAVKDNWVYSEVHTAIARVGLELKLALEKSHALDMFLDSCALNNQDIDVAILNKDVDDLIDNITKCLSTVQTSQIRLNKLQRVIVDAPKDDDKLVVENTPIKQIEDEEAEVKDEVFYFVRTDDEPSIQPADVTTAPGKRERETTKIVLSELKRKLGKREDVMRERERQALVKTMPGLKNIPEFPRQINFDEFIVKKGYIHKLKCKSEKKKLFRHYKIESKASKRHAKRYGLKIDEYTSENDIKGDLFEANALLNVKSKLFTMTSENKRIFINKLHKARPKSVKPDLDLDSSGMEFSDDGANKAVKQALNEHEIKIKFTKKDLDLSESSESDFEYYKNQRALLNDARRHRAIRKKNHQSHRRPGDNKENIKAIDNVDESMKPIEYNFGTGLAMASVLQVNNPKFLHMAQEEVFIGDGEVSNDSGNDEDA